MKERFKPVTLRTADKEMVDRCNAIIEEYSAQGLRMTLRQLYYQLVARAVIPNEPKAYDRLGDLIGKARLGGFIDWAAIEDRGREPISPPEWPDVNARIESALGNYRLPRWEGQTHYVELWVEKQALAGVLAPLANEYHVTLMVNKGYSSLSAMYESAKRYIWACSGQDAVACTRCNGTGSCARCGGDGIELDEDDENAGTADAFCASCAGSGACVPCSGSAVRRERFKEPWLFYLGDHDPSGEDMVRDIKDRMELFGVDGIRVFKIALTMTQIERYDPPPNPAKITDSRAKAYIEKFGGQSWEVDALPPTALEAIIRNAFDRIVDRPKMDAIIAREEADKARLRQLLSKTE